ncbi:MAG TPA: phosphodiester glycosidase family protein [Acidimicrobiales bacterium]|nr:phosphodiester glycosidase family protein [Acidimicrobiales bacterium]
MNSPRHAYRPPVAPKNRRYPAFVYWRRRAIVALAVVTIVVLGYLGTTLGFALTNPSYGVTLQARFAEWGRQHGLGSEVTWIETEYYKLNPAKVGGKPPLAAFGSGKTTVRVAAGGHLPEPKRIPSPAGTPLPGEGVWHVVGRETATGVPTMYEAFVRPDAIHTSYVVGVAWMDPTLLQAQLYSGSTIPGGGPYPYTAPITAKSSENLVAAFNAGFRMSDANGGYYTDGRTLIPLRNGAASAVVFKDGTMTVGKWGRDVTMSSQVASVRQNLDLIVDNARPVPGLTNANVLKWGKTLGGGFNVWRSGLGVTRDGALVYVGGPSLSISDLANVLVRAGAVRAMELDINTDWVQFSSFAGPLNTPINGSNGTSLENAMAGNALRYFATWWTRDFYTMTLRPKETTSPKG